ncbi:protein TRIGALACTOSYLDIACYLGLYCEROL 4 [Pyrus ussuriensis x Pyrus communis]|uniref:Protein TRIGALACTOSYLDIACYLGLYCEROL 4 n=1 Tax=Pyrus ussuriensis x Pyrus communis TaxID=2448454 RepID=A0A5N5F9M9_9ROSA|nr:protein TRIGALACTOSYLDIACYLGLYCEROL 4 [Pyrus ussuriensis x Pyrus communis]
MANLRTAMDSAFWDLNVSSPQTLEGSAKAVPGDPFPLDGARANRALRIQQLFLLGVIPSYNPNSYRTWLSDILIPLLHDLRENRWLGLIGQFRPKKLFSCIKAEVTNDEMGVPTLKDVVKRVLDKSLYSFGLCTQLLSSPSSSIKLSTEGHGEKKGRRNKLMLFHKAVNSVDDEAPPSLMPGFCAKAAFSYEKSQDLWSQNETRKDIMIQKEKGLFWRPSYDVRLKEPHAAVYGTHIFCGGCTAWFQDGYNPVAVDMSRDEGNSWSSKKRSPFSIDFFGSLCYTFQHGKFGELYGDLTWIDARLDICSASPANSAKDPMSSPRINLIFQQQLCTMYYKTCIVPIKSSKQIFLKIFHLHLQNTHNVQKRQSGKATRCAFFSSLRLNDLVEKSEILGQSS